MNRTVETTAVEIFRGGAEALEAIERGAIDIQVSTAKAYPRSVEKAQKEAIALACTDQETAESMIYALPRGDKLIEGPSVRLAEIVGYCWQNLRVQGTIVAVEERQVIAMGTAFDLERNQAVQVTVPLSIITNKGTRYSDDLIAMTCRRAVAMSRRDAILAVVPRVFVKPIEEAARKKALGEGGKLEQNRQRALAWLSKLGVDDARVCALLGIESVQKIGEQELLKLLGLRNEIHEGEISVEEAFPKLETEDEPGAPAARPEGSPNEKVRKGGKTRPKSAAPARGDGEDGGGETSAAEPSEAAQLEARYEELRSAAHPLWLAHHWTSWERTMLGGPRSGWGDEQYLEGIAMLEKQIQDTKV